VTKHKVAPVLNRAIGNEEVREGEGTTSRTFAKWSGSVPRRDRFALRKDSPVQTG